jgi:hypothetical protein
MKLTGFVAWRPVVAALFLALLPAPALANNLIGLMTRDLGDHRPHGCPSRWCACYLDRMLEQAGFSPLDSYRARDFAGYGKKAKPMTVGAIMVMAHHVGVVAGQCSDGRVKLISGNHGHKVGLGCYSPGKAIAWRLPVR